MVDPCDRYVARKFLQRGLEWERSLPQEVWIMTFCRERKVYATYEETQYWWDLVEQHGDRCDWWSMEKCCQHKHSLLKGANEVPVASFEHAMMQDRREYWNNHPDYVSQSRRARKEQERNLLAALPPLMLRPSSNPDTGVVYVIMAEGDPSCHVKIGRSFSAGVRTGQLQVGCPYPLTLLREITTKDTLALELALHNRYAQYRKQGEWFKLPAHALQEVLEESFV